jgi:Protein of unknown function (DUF1616)
VSAAAWEVVIGLPLVFFVPGYTVAKALFPEWRVRGSLRWRRLLEIATLAFVLSVVLTVLVGGLLLAASPSGFQASWSDPEVEVILGAVALVGFVAGWVRGSYGREPPSVRTPEEEPGAEGAWELQLRLDELAREERRVRHRLRAGGVSGAERSNLEGDLERLRGEQESLGRSREAEYGQ